MHGLILFSLTYLVAVATPGPGIAALLARVLGRGATGLAPFIAGYVAGDLIWFVLAAGGMAMVARSAHWLFLLIRYAGAAYLLFLAYRLWTAPVRILEADVVPPREIGAQLFMSSFSLTMGNPKVMVFYLALLPTVVDLQHTDLAGFALIALALCVILIAVLVVYALIALRARQLFRNRSAVRWLNRGTGTVMAGAAIAVAAG